MPTPINLDQLLAAASQAQEQVTTVATTAGTQMQNVGNAASMQMTNVADAAATIANVATNGATAIRETLARAIDELHNASRSATGRLQDLIGNIPRVQLPAHIKVNGVVVSPDNPDELFKTIKGFAENGGQIVIHIEGPLAIPLAPITTNREEMRRLLLSHFGIPNSAVLTPNPIAESTLVTVIICLTIVVIALGLGGPLVLGTSAILFAMAAALLIALVLGYDIDVRLCDALAVDTPPGFPGANLNLCKEFILTKKRDVKEIPA